MNLGFPEMLFLALLALIIFGPRRLPEIGRQIGKAMAEFKRASNEFKSQLETEMRQLELEESTRRIAPDVPEPPHGTIASGTSYEDAATQGESPDAQHAGVSPDGEAELAARETPANPHNA